MWSAGTLLSLGILADSYKMYIAVIHTPIHQTDQTRSVQLGDELLISMFLFLLLKAKADSPMR